jgi:uncharacterized membrane protein YeaQ/YmgE (transglycosylase-associated protein family)
LDVFVWIFFGLIAGSIAKVILPAKTPDGVIITILLGIVGSLNGGFISRTLWGYGRINDIGDFSRPEFLMSLLLAFIGSFILLAGYVVKCRRLIY